MGRVRIGLSASVCLLLAGGTGAGDVSYVVDDPGDPVPTTGTLTLRQALASAEADGQDSVITFDLPTPAKITLDGPTGFLPALVEGRTWVQGPGADALEIDAIGLLHVFNAQSDGNAISGLSLYNTASAHILIGGGAENNWVWGCRLGLDAAGGPGGVINHWGILITGRDTAGNLIGTDGGTPPPGNVSPGAASDEQERNIISNNDEGIVIADRASRNRVAGNFVGSDISGLSAVGNGIGVELGEGASQNCIGVSDASAPTDLLGGGESAEWNLISGMGLEFMSAPSRQASGLWMGTGSPETSSGLM